MWRDIGLGIQVLDDRGRRFTVHGRETSELHILRRSLRFGELHREMHRTTWANVGWAVLAVAISIPIGLVLRRVAPGYAGTVWPLVCSFVIAHLVFRVTHVNAARRRVLQGKVREIVASGRCPACEFSLADSSVGDDGCRICSECGAAWKSSTSSPPPPPSSP